MNSKQQNHIGIFLVILVIAALSRFYGLDRLSLWADELWVVVASMSGSLPDMLSAVYYRDNHPPGHYLLVRYTQFLFGSSDFAIRLPSAAAGVALVAATFASARKIFSARAAVIAAALVAGSYQAIYYSQEARPNIFVALFALLAFHYFCMVALECKRTPKNYFLFWMAALACSYFHYAGLVFCVCLGVVFLIAAAIKHKKDDVVCGAKLFFPVILLYLPWVFGTFRHLVSTPVTGWQRPPDFNTLQTTFNFLFGPDTIRIVFYQIILAVTVVVAFFSVFVFLLNKTAMRGSTDKPMLVLYAATMIFMPVGIFYIKSVFSQDAYNHRHFLYAIPLMAILAGYYFDEIICRLPGKIQAGVFFSVITLIILYQAAANHGRGLYSANNFKQEFRETAQVVANDLQLSKSADANDVLIISNTVFFDHYLNRFTEPHRKSDFIYDWDEKLAALSALVKERHAGEFYYLEAPILPGANNMITAEDLALMDNYLPSCRTRFKRAQVFKFSIVDKPQSIDIATLPDCRKN